jgi:hypothetical protein
MKAGLFIIHRSRKDRITTKMTYNSVQSEYKRLYGKSIKSCWIADAKRELHLTKRIAYNRLSLSSVKHPCPTVEIKERIIKIIQGN